MYLNGDVIIEVTRWCNLECYHCLRGSRQRMRQTYNNMYDFLIHFRRVETVTLTGGEPTLAPDIIGLFIDACRNLNLDVGNYYIATNAERITRKFLDVWERLHHWCSDNEISSVTISNDHFHQGNQDKYKLFDFAEEHGLECHYKYDKFKPDYQDCISEGRAKDWNERKVEKTPFLYRLDDDLEPDDESQDISYIEGELYLNCKGNVIHGCDWSFKSQDKPENIIAHVKDFRPEMILKLGERED